MPAEGGTLLWRQCVALAGALGETGVQEITLTSPDGTGRVLAARETDLPGTVFASAIGDVLEARGLSLTVVREADRWRVTRAEGPIAAGIERLLATR